MPRPALRRAGLCGLVCLAWTATAFAFQQQDVRRLIERMQDRADSRNPANEWRLSAMPDRDAERWLDRAREATEREDWKLAADTLSRVIDEYGDRTVSPDNGQRFYSAARAARDQFLKWPADGLTAYRLLYDGEAQGLLNQAKQSHDLDALRLIARKFPMTTPAPEALDLLANWLIDRGSGGEAVEVLEQLEALPHADISAWRIFSRMAVAYAITQQYEKSTTLIEQLRQHAETDPSRVPSDWHDRLEAISAFVNSGAAPKSDTADLLTHRAWPQILGPSYSLGRMQPTQPAITSEDVWRDLMPGSQRVDTAAITHLIRSTGRPPVWQCVSDGKAIFLSCPDGVMARDLGTFDLLWRSVPKAQPRDQSINQFRAATGISEPDNADQLDEMSTISLFHEYRGAISTAHGLVFMIEQFGTNGERYPTKKGVVHPNDSMMAANQGEPNSLRAFEADTGRAVWTRGRGGPANDELRFVHFFSTPIACGPHVIVPYQSGSDLNLAVLEPDGRLVRKVLLGSGRPGIFPFNAALTPTVHEGTIYVPTGAGLLIALNAYDHSLRWLASYDRVHLSRRQSHPQQQQIWVGAPRSYAQPDEWLSSPPLVVAGSVILAPPDGDRLLAYDRQTGELRWSYPRGRLRYVIGADTQRIILGGDKVMAINALTGAALWSNDDANPTGRPAFCGGEILVPTVEGLIRLNAQTGKEIGALLVSQEPLGNLLALDGALYSITPAAITKFPDIEQSRAAANQALAQNPSDWRALLRLAWLSAMERDYKASLDLMDRAEEFLTSSAHSDVLARIAHQRVEVLLNLALESDPLDRQPILQRATETARRPDDIIRASLAMIELLAERGDLESALEKSLTLLAHHGDQALAIESNLSARAIVPIREHIQRILQSSSANPTETTQTAERVITQFLTDAGDQTEALTRLAEGLARLADTEENSTAESLAELTARIELTLGNRAFDAHDLETAAFHWERIISTDPRRPAAREALCRLALLYTKPGNEISPIPAEAERVLDLLAAHHRDAAVPSSVQLQMSPQTSAADGATAAMPDFIRHARSLLPGPGSADRPSMPRILQSTPRLQIVATDEVPTSISRRDTVSFFDPSAHEDHRTPLVPIQKLSQVIGLNTEADARELSPWMIDLGPVIEDQISTIRDWATLDTRPAAIAGRVAVLASGLRITAVGLMTGRVMWPAIFADALNDSLPDPPIIHIDGLVIIATTANSIVAVPARQDGKPVWRRQFPGKPLGRLEKADGQLVAIDASSDTLTVIDPASGRVRRQYGLFIPGASKARELQVEQALKEIIDAARENLSIDDLEKAAEPIGQMVAVVGSTVCRAGQSRVVGRDVSTGRTIWDLPMSGLVVGLLKLNDKYLGICHGRHRIAVVDASSGQVVRDISARNLQLPPQDAVVDGPPGSQPLGGERLLIFARSTGESPQYVLASYPLGDGDKAWRQELGPLATISKRMMRASPDYIAAVAYEIRTDGQQRNLQRAWWARNAPILSSARLFIFDKGGERRMIESPFSFSLSRRPDDRYFSGLISDIIVLDERIIAVGPDGYYVLQAEPRQAAMDVPGEPKQPGPPETRRTEVAP